MIERQWQKPGRCEPNGGECVEVAVRANEVAVRDGKLGEDSPVLVFDLAEWAAHQAAILDGQYALDGAGRVAAIAEAIGSLSDIEMLELSATIKSRTMDLLLRS